MMLSMLVLVAVAGAGGTYYNLILRGAIVNRTKYC